MSMSSEARGCGVDPDASEDREFESRFQYHFECNTCGATEHFAQYRSNHVCPWCGDGVMQLEVTDD